MPFSIFKKFRLGKPKPANILLQFTDKCLKYSKGIQEDMFVNVDKFIFLVDFVVVDMEKNMEETPMILGRIDFLEGMVIIRVKDEEVTFDVLEFVDFPPTIQFCNKVNDLISKACMTEPPRSKFLET